MAVSRPLWPKNLRSTFCELSHKAKPKLEQNLPDVTVVVVVSVVFDVFVDIVVVNDVDVVLLVVSGHIKLVDFSPSLS